MANIIAQTNPSTENPGTIREARSIRSALIIRVNKPKVRIVIGKVKIIKTGFNKIFNKPNTTAKTTAVPILLK